VLTSDDGIDLDSGFLMLPQTIPVAAHPPGPGPVSPGPTPPPPGPGPALPVGPGPTPLPPGKVAHLTFAADSDQLYNAWNAVANLADLAGKLELTIRAESEKGFDKSKLDNGVLEPLREIELID
jgi:hypothetical protein